MWVRSHILKSDNAMDFSRFMPLFCTTPQIICHYKNATYKHDTYKQHIIWFLFFQ